MDVDKNKMIDDFIFMCYLCGNDFIPNIPNITFKHVINEKNGL